MLSRSGGWVGLRSSGARARPH